MRVSAIGIVKGTPAVALAVALSACATSQIPPQHLASSSRSIELQAPAEPLEPLNRSVFETNQQINHGVIYPVASAYRDTVPEPVRDSIDAFTGNLSEPFVFANNLLQLRLNAAATTLSRFVVNSTLGIGGLFDVAQGGGLTKQTGDFGQTLYVWGVRESEYLMLPVVGPTNVRDAIGNGVELAAQFFISPMLPATAATAANYAGTVGTVATPVASLSKVEQMQELERSSLDFYSMMRSVVQQKREAELREALKESPLSALPWLSPGWENEAASGLQPSPASEGFQPSPASEVLEPSPASEPPALQPTPAPALKEAPALVTSRTTSSRTRSASQSAPSSWAPTVIGPADQPMGLGATKE